MATWRNTTAAVLAMGVMTLTMPAQAAIDIVFDYSLDTNGFFASDAQRRETLEQAAGYFEALFTDELDAITPGTDGNSWIPFIFHPGTGAGHNLGNLSIATNEIRVYAGGHDLSGSTLGQGAPGGYTIYGTPAFTQTAVSRGEGVTRNNFPDLGDHATDFGPWGGSIMFDTATNWHFGATTAGLDSSTYDFLSVALHELGHLLGFGSSDSFNNLAVDDLFTGTESMSVYGSHPLLASSGHWADDTMSGGQEAAMSPYIGAGERKLLTALDIAAFADIGWQVVIPEPGTLVLLGAGALAVLRRRRLT